MIIFMSLLILMAAFLLESIQLFEVRQKAKKWYAILPCILLLTGESLNIVYLVMLMDGNVTGMLPLFLYPAASSVWLIGSIVSMYLFHRRYRSIISKGSIKEATDQVPLGLCYYEADGMPILTNHQMNELAAALTGEPVCNAKTFSAKVNGKTLQAGERFYSFREEPIDCKDRCIYQLCAVDITKLHQLSLDLDKENAKLKGMNDRLLEYSKNVETLVREEEILKAKMDIHDKMGRMLLETKIFLENGNTDYRELVAEWGRTMQIFKGSFEAEPGVGGFERLKKIAASLQLDIMLKGEIPEEPIFLDAVKECITNAVRHAGATRLTITADRKRIEIANNGTVPQAGITEGGGLTYLRQKVEKNGGTMRVDTKDGFVLIINL